MVKKIEGNQKVGAWAEDKGYYDAAISRYYYAIYQQVLTKMNDREETARYIDRHSHANTLDYFITYALKRTAPQDASFLYWLNNFRQARNKADYEKYVCEPDKFSDIKKKYEIVQEIMSRLP